MTVAIVIFTSLLLTLSNLDHQHSCFIKKGGLTAPFFFCKFFYCQIKLKCYSDFSFCRGESTIL